MHTVVDLQDDERTLAGKVPPGSEDAFFELVGYPIEATTLQNDKFLLTDSTYLDAARSDLEALKMDSKLAETSYSRLQQLTKRYNSLGNGKWDGMMSAAPRERHVFEMPVLATAGDAAKPLPATWGAGDESSAVSINAARYTRKKGDWRELANLGISGSSMVLGDPGLDRAAPNAELDYDFTSKAPGDAMLQIHLLPTFALDSGHKLRYAVALDNQPPVEVDEARDKSWAANVLSNDAIATVPLGDLAAGPHTLHFLYRDPGLILQHLVVTFPNTPPAYPVPPETKR